MTKPKQVSVEALARAIFQAGDAPASACQRMAFMGGTWPDNEKDQGGVCETALAGVIGAFLDKSRATLPSAGAFWIKTKDRAPTQEDAWKGDVFVMDGCAAQNHPWESVDTEEGWPYWMPIPPFMASPPPLQPAAEGDKLPKAREGWMTAHPTTEKPVEVVTREDYDWLLEKAQARIEELERERNQNGDVADSIAAASLDIEAELRKSKAREAELTAAIEAKDKAIGMVMAGGPEGWDAKLWNAMKDAILLKPASALTATKEEKG